jgi:hypothetical protein
VSRQQLPLRFGTRIGRGSWQGCGKLDLALVAFFFRSKDGMRKEILRGENEQEMESMHGQ